MPWLMYSGNTLSIRWKIMYFLNLKLFMKISTCLCEIFFLSFCLRIFFYMATNVFHPSLRYFHATVPQQPNSDHIHQYSWFVTPVHFLVCMAAFTLPIFMQGFFFFFYWFSWRHTCHFSDQARVMKCCMESSYIGIDLSIRPSPRMQTSQWQSSISCMGSGTRTSLGFSAIEKHWKIRSSYQFYGVYAKVNAKVSGSMLTYKPK